MVPWIWIVGFLIALVALAIPILAIVLDSPALHRFLDARRGETGDAMNELTRRVALLEDEVDEIGRALQGVKDDTQFLQRLLESAEERRAHRELPPPDAE